MTDGFRFGCDYLVYEGIPGEVLLFFFLHKKFFASYCYYFYHRSIYYNCLSGSCKISGEMFKHIGFY